MTSKVGHFERSEEFDRGHRILPDTTHVTLVQRIPVIVPMVNDFLGVNGFLDAKL